MIDFSAEPMWGISDEADFTEGTWTFKMTGSNWQVSAGAYAILHNDDYQALAHDAKDMLTADTLLQRVLQLRDRLPADLREAIDSYFDPRPLG